MSILFDYFGSGEMPMFHVDFPDMTPGQVEAVLQASLQLIEQD